MPPLPIQPLWADIGDILGAAAAIIIPLAYVLHAIFAARKKDAPPLGGPQRQAPPRAAQQPQQPAQRPQQKALADEVEQFLRRAAERRAGGRPRDVEVLRPEEPPKPQPRPAQRPQTPRQQTPRPRPASQRPLAPPRPVEAVVVETLEERIERDSVESTVAQHLDAKGFTSRAEQLTSLDQADEQMEEHLHSVFDHRVGTLGRKAESISDDDPGSVPTPKVATSPTTLADILTSPANLRNAIVLSEVFRRPEERW